VKYLFLSFVLLFLSGCKEENPVESSFPYSGSWQVTQSSGSGSWVTDETSGTWSATKK